MQLATRQLLHIGISLICAIPAVLAGCEQMHEDWLRLTGVDKRELTPRKVPGAIVLRHIGPEVEPDHIFLKETEGMKVGVDKQGKRAVLQHANGAIVLLDLASGHVIRELEPSARRGDVFHTAFSPTAPLLALSFYRPYDGRPHDLLCVWNYETGATETVAAAADEGSSNIIYSPNGSLLAYRHGPSNIDFLTIKDITTGRSVDMEASAFGVCFSANSRMVSEGATVWDLSNFPQIKSMPHLVVGAFAPDGQRAYGFVDPIRPYSGQTENRDALVYVYATSTWNRIEMWDLPRAHYDQSGYGELAVTADSKRLLVMSEQGISVWDIRDHKEVAFLKGRYLDGMELLADDKHVAALSPSGIFLWTLP